MIRVGHSDAGGGGDEETMVDRRYPWVAEPAESSRNRALRQVAVIWNATPQTNVAIPENRTEALPIPVGIYAAPLIAAPPTATMTTDPILLASAALWASVTGGMTTHEPREIELNRVFLFSQALDLIEKAIPLLAESIDVTGGRRIQAFRRC